MSLERFDAQLTVVSCDYPPCDATTSEWTADEAAFGASRSTEAGDWVRVKLYDQPRDGSHLMQLCPKHAHLRDVITMVEAVMTRVREQKPVD